MKAKLQWVVQPDDGALVSEVLSTMRAQGANTDGRVFVNGRPAQGSDSVDRGDYLEVWPARAAAPDDEVRIVAQRDGVLLVYKPAGLPSETTQLGQNSVKSALLKRLAGAKLHAASRLDTQVSGLVTFALGRDAARRIDKWRQRGQMRRTYIAIARGVTAEAGHWRWPLHKRRDRGGRHHSAHDDARGKAATTEFERLATAGERASLLRLAPETGRLHQLRAHAKLAGCPLFGDRLYGGDGQVCDDDGRVHLVKRIALHAIAVDLPAMDCYAPPPTYLARLWQQLGGSSDDYRRTEPRDFQPRSG